MSKYIKEGKIHCVKDMNLIGIPNAFKKRKIYTYKETKREKIVQNLEHASKYCTMFYKDSINGMTRFEDHFDMLGPRRKKIIDGIINEKLCN